MRFLAPAACPLCIAKDETIARLDKRVEELEKTLLAMVDPRAYNLRYPKPHVPHVPGPPGIGGLMSPAQLRDQVYEPVLTAEQIEREFEEIKA